MLRLLFWPFREFFRFFAMLWLLVTFTSVGNFVDGRGLAFHIIEKGVQAWTQVRAYVSEASARVNTSKLDTVHIPNPVAGGVAVPADSDTGAGLKVTPDAG